MTKKKKKKESWKEKRRQAAIKHQKALEAERLRREREPKKSKGWTRSKVFGIGFLFLIFLVIGVYAAWQNTQPSNGGELPPLYTLTDARFSEFRGKVVVVDCFATWCEPCIIEFDHLKEVNNKYDSSEVVVVSVGSSGDSVAGLRQFKKDYNMDWFVSRDTVGVFNEYDAGSIPTLVILDQNGDTHYRNVGVTGASTLMSKIDELLGTQPPNGGELPSLYTLTDAEFSEFRGKVVLVDCFATWCEPCIIEFDHLKEVNDKYDSSEVVVVSVGSSGDSVTGLRQFKKDYNMDWLVSRDTVEVFNEYDVESIPTLVILDQNGDTHYRNVGVTDASTLISKIDELLGP